jgi:hypothetical protein
MPGGGWSEHGGNQQTGADRRLPVRRGPLCAVGAAAEVSIAIADVPEGVGRPFASLADIGARDFSWTSGKPATFQSSSIAERDFCAACGTPLTYRLIGGPRIEIMTGTFDRPDRVVPTRQYGTESGSAGWSASPICRARPRMQNYGPEKMATITSHQHPDTIRVEYQCRRSGPVVCFSGRWSVARSGTSDPAPDPFGYTMNSPDLKRSETNCWPRLLKNARRRVGYHPGFT